MIRKSIEATGKAIWSLPTTRFIFRKCALALGEDRVKRMLETVGFNGLSSRRCDLSEFFVNDFVHGDSGHRYGVSVQQKQVLVDRFRQNTSEIKSGTSFLIHTILAREILSVPPEIEGQVVECGCWKGASTASLSLACELAGRRLLVCDSFEGLPDDGLQLHTGMHFGNYGYYKEGMFCGTLAEVQQNVDRHGCIQVCEFIKGFFADSLQSLSQPIIFAFLDVDLVSSTYDCLRYIWPLLVESGYIYTDDSGDMDVVRCFFNDEWWTETLGCRSPGYVGSGCGLPMNPHFSSLGYTRKRTHFDPELWTRSSHLYYPEAEKEAPRETDIPEQKNPPDDG